MHRNWFPLALVLSCSAPTFAQVRPFGTGCVGHLTRAPGMTSSVPMVARANFDLRIDAVANNAPFLLIIGTSNTTWSGIALPLSMSNFGFPGCFLNVAYDKVFALVSDGGGRVTLPVRGAKLKPLRLYSQLVVPESRGSRISASQGFELTVEKSVKPFTIFALPDTQHYVSAANSAIFAAQTQWIVGNRSKTNGVFVSHVGDMVNSGAGGAQKNKAQWDRALIAMARLDGDLKVNPNGLIPYATAIGNRDYDSIHVKPIATEFTRHFGPTRYTGRTWFRGASPNGLNTYQVFAANGEEFLHLALEWRADDRALSWAQGVLTAHPDLPAIVSTHQYLAFRGKFDTSGGTPNSGGDNGGLGIRHKLVEPFPQIFLVLCGHNHGSSFRTGKTLLAQPVLEVLMDYSFDPNGGNGWMNVLECRPDRAQIKSSCFSPTFRPGIDPGPDRRFDSSSNFTVDLDLRAHRRRLEATRVIHFTGGHDHGHGTYTGARDTFVSSTSPTSAFGSATDVKVQDPVGSSVQHGLIAFGGIFGTGSGQVPKNKRIVRAILTLTTEGAGAVSKSVSNVFRLRVPFDEKSTWRSLNGGIRVGTSTVATPVATTGNLVATAGTRSFDVTATVRAWRAGATNHGWAVLSTGSDSWSFRSKDWGTPAERPMLTVVFER